MALVKKTNMVGETPVANGMIADSIKKFDHMNGTATRKAGKTNASASRCRSA